MRTRFLPKMTNCEVEDYLHSNDLIFVPVGVVETHGSFPLDCETIIAEAFAIKLAEAANGLVLNNLPYFYAGGTVIGRGTVQMSIKDGTNYLDKIAHSLLKQGFRRQIYISLHGPASLTVEPMIRDFFEETKVPIIYIEFMRVIGSKMKNFSFDKLNDMIIGGYALLGKLEEVPLNVPESNSVSYSGEPDFPEQKEYKKVFSSVGFHACTYGSYFAKPSQHGMTPLLRTPKERSARAEIGIKLINEIVDGIDIMEIAGAIRTLDNFTKDAILPQHEMWLP
jgi:creatinine amidohydrolase